MRRIRSTTMAAAVLAGCLLAGHAMAQTTRGPGMMQGWGPGYGMMQGYGPGYGTGYGMMGDGGMMMGMMGGHTAGMLAFLKTEIGITAAQEPQWSKFAEALGGMAGGMRGGMMRQGQSADPAKPQPLPEALATRVGWMESHLAAMKAVRDAAGPLYAVLSAEQKTKADTLMGCGPCGW